MKKYYRIFNTLINTFSAVIHSKISSEKLAMSNCLLGEVG